MFKQSGIAIDLVEREFKDKTTSTIELQPFTSRGVIGRAMLEIPLEDVPAVIEAMQKMVSKTPTDDKGFFDVGTINEFTQRIR